MDDSCLAILAGGDGKRIGYYKPLIELNNKKLIEYTLENLGPYFSFILLVVKSSTQRELLMNSIRETINKYDTKIVVDKVSLNGPIAGLITAIDYCDRKLLAIAPSDAPFIKFHIYKHLSDYVVYQNYDAAVPIWPNNYVEPLVSFAIRDKVSRVASENIMKKKLRIQDIYAGVHTAYINVYSLSSSPLIEFFNINRYEDLESARRILSRLNQATLKA